MTPTFCRQEVEEKDFTVTISHLAEVTVIEEQYNSANQTNIVI